MAGLGDAHTTEVNGQNVERGIGGTLENACQSAYKRVGTIGGHGIYHQSTGPTSAQGFHDGGGESTHKIAIDATELYSLFDGSNKIIHGSRSTEHANGHQDGHQIRDDAHGGSEAFFGTLYKGIVYVHLLTDARQDEADDDQEQEYIGAGGGVDINLRATQSGKNPNDAGYNQTHASKEQQQGAVKQINALI